MGMRPRDRRHILIRDRGARQQHRHIEPATIIRDDRIASLQTLFGLGEDGPLAVAGTRERLDGEMVIVPPRPLVREQKYAQDLVKRPGREARGRVGDGLDIERDGFHG